ncbi:MAG: PHP domain-containing protein [Candidatus Levyibacteriota bacterium]
MRELYGRSLKGYQLADLHMHTKGSIDVARRGGMTPGEAVFLARKSGLSAIAITDHDNIDSSFEGQQYAAANGLDIQVVTGMEITTKDGHLIGVFLKEGISAVVERGDHGVVRRSMKNVIKKIHGQGGLAIVPHPFYKRLDSADRELFNSLERSTDPDVYIDGYEVHNMGVVDASSMGGDGYRDSNTFAQEYRRSHKGRLGAAVGSSDGHRLTVGRGLTAYKGDLYAAIKNQETMAVVLDPEDHGRLLRNAVDTFGLERVIDNIPKRDRDKVRQFISEIAS